jgi:hypothetical protein
MTQESQTSAITGLQTLSEKCHAHLPGLTELLRKRQSWEDQEEKLENQIQLLAADQQELGHSRLYAANGLRTFALCHLDSALSCLAHQKELFAQVTGFIDPDMIEHFQDSVADDLAYAPMFHPALTEEGLVMGELLLFLEHLEAAQHLMQKMEALAAAISEATGSLNR